MAATTWLSALKLWPLTSASQCGSVGHHAAGLHGELWRSHAG